MADCDCDGAEAWDAWHDRMPGGAATLHVVGTCNCPLPGYTLELQRQEPQGINPRDLLLRLVETAPNDGHTTVITPVPVEFRRKTEASYDTVSIVPDGPVGIPVRNVS
jgi:hypothetical protein